MITKLFIKPFTYTAWRLSFQHLILRCPVYTVAYTLIRFKAHWLIVLNFEYKSLMFIVRIAEFTYTMHVSFKQTLSVSCLCRWKVFFLLARPCPAIVSNEVRWVLKAYSGVSLDHFWRQGVLGKGRKKQKLHSIKLGTIREERKRNGINSKQGMNTDFVEEIRGWKSFRIEFHCK